MEFEKVRDIIVDILQVSPDEVTTETRFSDLDADSIDLYEIVTEISNEFDIEISDEDAMAIETVGDALEKIRSTMNA